VKKDRIGGDSLTLVGASLRLAGSVSPNNLFSENVLCDNSAGEGGSLPLTRRGAKFYVEGKRQLLENCGYSDFSYYSTSGKEKNSRIILQGVYPRSTAFLFRKKSSFILSEEKTRVEDFGTKRISSGGQFWCPTVVKNSTV